MWQAKVLDAHQRTFAAEMWNKDTIAAMATSGGLSATAMIRMSGPKAIDIAAVHCGKTLLKQQANSASFHRFRTEEGTVLDDVVVTIFRSPRSYTGEDVVEFSFHGSAYILNAALEALMASGARLATPGEFTQRALLNGKMDLSQAEAVADLIASESAAEHRLAMHQMRGGFSKEIKILREELIHFASLIELELDFAEEDVEFANRAQLIALIERIRAYVKHLVSSFRVGNAIKNGVPVAIIGRPNAGKSTLLNALLNDERAIVSEIAGTTRDSIEDTAVINGIRFRFIDTAGIRSTTDTIERMGVERSLDKMANAAVVLYLFDVRDSMADHEAMLKSMDEHINPEQTRVIRVANKSDLSSLNECLDADIRISAKTGDGLDALQHLLCEAVGMKSLQSGEVIVTNQRHLEALKNTEKALSMALESIHQGASGELVASDIRAALYSLGSITGEITADDLLGNIFSKFCIGK